MVTFHRRQTDTHMDTAVCVFVCLFLAAFPHYCTDPDVTWGNGSGCPLALRYWADLQLVHGFRCYDNIHIFKHIALYTANAYSTELEMSASACTRSIASLLSCRPPPPRLQRCGKDASIWWSLPLVYQCPPCCGRHPLRCLHAGDGVFFVISFCSLTLCLLNILQKLTSTWNRHSHCLQNIEWNQSFIKNLESSQH